MSQKNERAAMFRNIAIRSELNGVLKVHSQPGNRGRCYIRCLASAAMLAASTRAGPSWLRVNKMPALPLVQSTRSNCTPIVKDERIDIRGSGSNNRAMTKPEAVRRIKSYSAANGYVYQYYFYELNRVSLGGGAAGEFVYAISADRGASFGLRILVMQAALDAWAAVNGRALTSSEEYAVAKMRLFQAFDEGVVPLTAEAAREVRLVVDEKNLEDLLNMLNI